MGAHTGDEEKVALLPYQPMPEVPEFATAVAGAEDAEREWNGHLLNCCAGCDATGCGSCLFGYFVPCLAFGHNMKKALRLSFLAQAAAFALFFFSGKALYLWSSQAVADSCPPPVHHHGAHGQHGPGHHHPNPMVADLPTEMMPGSFSLNFSEPHHPDLPPHMTPECQKALVMMNGLFCLAVLLAFFGVIYAARRRTQMRETFGIAGTRMRDFCSWFWCPLCALCQETRTVLTNNVHEGVWYGPTQLSAPTQPDMHAPAVKEMKGDFAKPVDAKDFV